MVDKSGNYILTAANEKYFKNLQQLIYSFKRAKEDRNSMLIFYDIGLTSQQANEIKKIEVELNGKLSYKHFHFERFPEFIRPEYNTYSWKPIIIHQASKEYRGNLLWMDSANCVLKELSPIWAEIESRHTFAPISGSGTLKEWTVQQTLDYLKVPKEFYSKENRAGNTFGFSTKSSVVKDLIFKWKEFALIRECIRPEGANRSNHRDDQSLLTILLLEQEEKGTLSLTNEKVNISAGSPTSYISVRNQFPAVLKLQPGLWAHYYFSVQRYFDMLVNKIKGN